MNRAGAGWRGCLAHLTACLAAASVLPAGPSEASAQLPIDIEAGASREVLSGDREPWEEYWIRATVRPSPCAFIYGGYRQTRRFGEDDRQVEGGAEFPLAERWSARLDGTWSGTHRVVPRWGASGTVSYRLASGWTLSGGGGRQVWETTAVNHQQVGVDRRFDRITLGYRLRLHQIEAGGSGIRHGVSGSWAYDARGSSITASLGLGQEATIVGPDDVRSTTEQSARLSGTHWVDDRTGIGYTFGIHRHGPFFTRSVSSVGIRRRF